MRTYSLGAWNTFICRSCPFKPHLLLVQTTNLLRKWFNFSLSALGKDVLFFSPRAGSEDGETSTLCAVLCKGGGIQCLHELKVSL